LKTGQCIKVVELREGARENGKEYKLQFVPALLPLRLFFGESQLNSKGELHIFV
jgi:hypothetical protein